MNVKRYFAAFVAFFVFMYLYEWFVHGSLLMPTYEQTAQLWRTPEAMRALLPMGFIYQLITAAWVTFSFTQFYKNGGVKQGLLFGLFIGVILGLHGASSYIWLPISSKLAWSWFFTSVIGFLAGGLILGAIYRKK